MKKTIIVMLAVIGIAVLPIQVMARTYYNGKLSQIIDRCTNQEIRREACGERVGGAQLGDRAFPIVNGCAQDAVDMRATICLMKAQIDWLQRELCAVIRVLHCLQGSETGVDVTCFDVLPDECSDSCDTSDDTDCTDTTDTDCTDTSDSDCTDTTSDDSDSTDSCDDDSDKLDCHEKESCDEIC